MYFLPQDKIKKRPNVPVSFTWFLSYIPLYKKNMTKECYMTQFNAFSLVIYEKIFKGFCYIINLYKNVSLYKGRNLNKLESPFPKDAKCQI